MNNEEIKEKIKNLQEKGIVVYSISRLNTVDECGLEYWNSYIKHLPSKQNIYTFAGSTIHSCLESLQNGININMEEELEKMLLNSDTLDIHFPTEQIGEKWIKNMKSFANSYVLPHYKNVETEKPFLFTINNICLQGIIDLVIFNEDKTIDIIDYKTSSKFSKNDLIIKGRQLILYGLGMEQLGYKVNRVAWNMLKYVEISYKLKNGKTRSTIAERGFILDKLKSDITKRLKDSKEYEEFDIEIMVEKAIQLNSFSELPKWIEDCYEIKDYILEYNFSIDNQEDTKKFITAKVNEIERFQDDESWWEPKEITKYTSFYCENLCGQRDNCYAFKEYKEREKYFNELNQEKNEEDVFF